MKFICDICKKQFDNQSDCSLHEQEHQKKIEEQEEEHLKRMEDENLILDALKEYKLLGKKIEAMTSEYNKKYKKQLVIKRDEFFDFFDLLFCAEPKRAKQFMDYFFLS